MRLRKPPAGEVWVHVDRLDREDRRVWAVQSQCPEKGALYQTCHNVVIQAACYTQFFGRDGKQPKAVIVVPGASVAVLHGIAVVSAHG